jgi:hypothetical protein
MLLFLSRYRSSLGNRSCIAFPKSRNLRHGVHSPASSEATQLAKVTMSSIQFMRISDTSGGMPIELKLLSSALALAKHHNFVQAANAIHY